MIGSSPQAPPKLECSEHKRIPALSPLLFVPFFIDFRRLNAIPYPASAGALALWYAPKKHFASE